MQQTSVSLLCGERNGITTSSTVRDTKYLLWKALKVDDFKEVHAFKIFGFNKVDNKNSVFVSIGFTFL